MNQLRHNPILSRVNQNRIPEDLPKRPCMICNKPFTPENPKDQICLSCYQNEAYEQQLNSGSIESTNEITIELEWHHPTL